jgi:hypothetical protein
LIFLRQDLSLAGYILVPVRLLEVRCRRKAGLSDPHAANDRFIVDNSDTDGKVGDYLKKWVL